MLFKVKLCLVGEFSPAQVEISSHTDISILFVICPLSILK